MRDPEADDLLLEVAKRISDEEPITWEDLPGGDGPGSATLEQLRLLEALGAAHREAAGPRSGDPEASWLRLRGRATTEGRLGRYEIRRKLGQGGMGTVYLAERADDEYRKQVAIKLVSPGWVPAEVLRRFRTERQVLAALEHLNIARLLDGGTTEDDVPYVVMEYVDGVPIDEFCERRGLEVEDRLDLFLAVCSAVAYAHRNLVVHRDVKPSNVLVSRDGTPKLLDFGIAKLLDPAGAGVTVVATREMQRLMTPEYASPEQVRGEAITTATDVYSLGALLYQLLTAEPPFRLQGKTAGEIERIVCEEEPERPSVAAGRLPARQSGDGGGPDPERRRRRLSGDLDNIILKALRKEPAGRYATVGELAEDVRRHLAGLPVLARPATLSYRAGKFLRRHRAAAAAALGGVLLLAATVAFYTYWVAAERDLARREADKAGQVTEFLVSLFRESSPRVSGAAEVTARELLSTGARRLESELDEQPEIHAELLNTIARVYFELGLLEEAGQFAERALATRLALFGEQSAEVADSREVLAQVRIDEADFESARDLLGQALAIRAGLFGAQSEEYAKTLYGLGLVELRAADDARAREILERVLALRERLHGPDHTEVATVLNLLGVLARRLDEPERAEALYRRTIAINERALGPHHPDLGKNLNNLGVLLSRTDRLEEARATYERALAIHERAYGPEHDLVAGTLDNLGETLKNLGRPEEAVPLLQRALAYRETRLGPHHHATGTTLNTLANIYREMGRFDEAIPLYERAIAANEASLGEEHFWVAWPLSNLGKLYLRRGDPALARPLFERSLELRRNALGEEHSLVAISLEDLGRLEEQEGNLPAAVALYRRAVEVRRTLPPAQRDELGETLHRLAEALTAAGAAAEAEPFYREAREIAGSGEPPSGS